MQIEVQRRVENRVSVISDPPRLSCFVQAGRWSKYSKAPRQCLRSHQCYSVVTAHPRGTQTSKTAGGVSARWTLEGGGGAGGRPDWKPGTMLGSDLVLTLPAPRVQREAIWVIFAGVGWLYHRGSGVGESGSGSATSAKNNC